MNEPEICAREDEGGCAGRISWEHALLYSNKRVQEKFAIIKLCALHHGIENYANCHGQNKRKHILLALSQATESDRKKYPRLPWYLIKYGNK